MRGPFRCEFATLVLLASTNIAVADVLVTSANANSIFRYDQTSGNFLQKFDNSSVRYPYGLAVGPDGFLYTATTDADSGLNTQIDRFDPVTGHRLTSSGLLPATRGMTIGPDGLIYLSAFVADEVRRYDPLTLSFVDVFASIRRPTGMTFGPDGNLYVGSSTDSVIKVNKATGALSTFILDPGLFPISITFGPDGNIYVGGNGPPGQVRRYSGSTGAFDRVFATAAGLTVASAIAFGPDGKLYVGNSAANVLRFDATTGAFIDVFIPTGSGGLGTNLTGILFIGTTQATNTVWPMSGRNPERQGLAPFNGPTTPPTAPAWIFPADTGPDSIIGDLAISAEGNIYAAAYNLYALKPDGTQLVSPALWSSIPGAPAPGYYPAFPPMPPVRIPSPFLTGPAIDERNGFVYIAVKNFAATDGIDIYRFDKQLQNPTVVYHKSPGSFGNAISELIVGTNGDVYFVTDRYPGTVTAIGPSPWSAAVCPFESSNTPAGKPGAPALGADGSVFVMCPGQDFSSGGGLFKLNGTTGVQLANTPYNRNATEPMVDNNGNIRSGWQAFGGAIFCGGYDAWDSSLIRLTPAPGRCDDSSGFATSRATLLPDGSTVRWGYSFGGQTVLQLQGTHSWGIQLPNFQTENFSSLPGTDALGNIFIGSNLGLYLLSPIDGRIQWKLATTGAVTTQPATSSNGGLYVGTNDGKVYAVGGPGGLSVGTISVTTNLDAATFTITGPATFTGSGKSFSTVAPIGSYTITYGSVSSYTPPATETKALVTNGTTTFTGTYQQAVQVGTIVVNSNRPEATFTISPPVAGFPTGGPYPVSQIAPIGTYTVTFSRIDGFTTPVLPPQVLPVNGTKTFDGQYTAIALPALIVDTTPMLFNYQEGSIGPVQGKTRSVTSSGASITFTAAATTNPSGQSWLNVTPVNGTTPRDIMVNVVEGLKAGTYSGQISIVPSATSNGSHSISVVLTVTSPAVTTGTFAVNSTPSGVNFVITQNNAVYTAGSTPFTKGAVPAGEYKLVWASLVGYYDLPAQTKTLTAGATTTFTGDFIPTPFPGGMTILDPIVTTNFPSLLDRAKITKDPTVLSGPARVVQGLAADGVTQVVLKIPATRFGQMLRLTVLDGQGNTSSATDENGAVGVPGGTVPQSSSVVVTSGASLVAFAIYRAPVDFSTSSHAFDSASTRRISIVIEDVLTGGASAPQTIKIVRPPVILVHGLWETPDDWNSFTPLLNDSRFFIRRVDYSFALGSTVASSTPTFQKKYFDLSTLKRSALGFGFNASLVNGSIIEYIKEFKESSSVAAVRADIVAHSMGGDIIRTISLMPSFLSNTTFHQGTIHKFITIGTPHLGSPIALKIDQGENKCVRDILGTRSDPALDSITLASGQTIQGGVGDLKGDGVGGQLSAALTLLQQPGHPLLYTAMIAGVMGQQQLDALNCLVCKAEALRFHCSGNSLADNLTSANWETIMGTRSSDGIVPSTSALNNTSATSDNTITAVHSSGTEKLGFGGPHEYESVAGGPIKVITLLNTWITMSNSFKLQ